ncbi:hypothetical protein [Bradyrhizobium sp. RT3b]|uniref:hypothetical protein n=1 Tax=Bradyrhizobium sp. RT3b TaxID=3156334 RepID=UPI0033917D6C
MSKNAWLKPSIHQHRINKPRFGGVFLFVLAVTTLPGFMTSFGGSLEALCKLQRITSVPQWAPRSAPLGTNRKVKKEKSSAAGQMTSNGFCR